jgi:hypothetical protein
LRVLGSGAFDISAVGGFAVAEITGNHAVFIQKVQVLPLALSSNSWRF